MRKHFMPECAGGWDSTIRILLKEGEDFTVDVKHRKLHISKGLNGEPLAEIQTDLRTLRSILSGDLPLDIAIMNNSISSDNMVETFKFVTVFRPVIRRRARAAHALTDSSVIRESRIGLLSILSEWGVRVSKDADTTEIVRRSGLGTSAEIYLKSPDILLSLNADHAGLHIEASEEIKSSPAALVIESRIFLRILRGAQNLMISLNNRELGAAIPDAFPTDMLRLLLDTQPTVSKVFRKLLNERELKK